MFDTAIFDNILDIVCIFVKILAATATFSPYWGVFDTFVSL